MAEEETSNPTSEKSRHRSPAWPFIPLAKAVSRAGEFYKAHRDGSALLSGANVSWGMKPKSGAGAQTISALKQYGFMQDSGNGTKLTEQALRIVRDNRETSPEREALLHEAVLKPPIFAEIFRKWGDELPSDADVEFYLVHQRSFSEDAAKGALANYKASFQYAGQMDSGNLGGSDGGTRRGDTPPPPKPPPSSTKLMEGERIVFTHELEPSHVVRVLASGDVDASLIDALELYVQLQKKRLGIAVRPETPKPE